MAKSRTIKTSAEKAAALPSRFEFKKSQLDILLKMQPLGRRKQWSYSDTKETGLTLLVSTTRAHERDARLTFRCCYYLPSRPGQPRYVALGSYPDEIDNIDHARDMAREIRIKAKKGIDPKRPPLPDRFDDIVGQFIEEYAKPKNKHWKETKRLFERYVLVEWRDLRIRDIGRPEIAALLDKIAAKKIKGPKGKMMGGPVTADRCLAAISKLFSWYSIRQNDFINPIVRGMRKTKPKERERKRILNGFEIRALWKATGDMGTYGAAVRTLLLTAQRLRKVQNMRRSDIKERMLIEGREIDGQWINDFWVEDVWDSMDDEDAENKQASFVPLSGMALEIINSVPIIDANSDEHEDFVFSLNGRKPINAWSKGKAELDKKMREELALLMALPENEGADPDLFALRPWVLHDLRRSAKTIMQRIGIADNISELCLGHVQGGVKAVYDRHDYILEKREAFARLAAHIERIINPPERANVIDLKAGKRAS